MWSTTASKTSKTPRPMTAAQLWEWSAGYEDTQSLKHGSTVIDIDKALQ